MKNNGEIHKKFKDVLKAERKRQRYSQRLLSEASGVCQGTIYHYEADSVPSLDNAHQLLSVLGVGMVIGDEKAVFEELLKKYGKGE